MNDEIERLNKENQRQNKYVSPGNFSKAATSSITTNEEDKHRSGAGGRISDVGKQMAEIDAIKQAIGQLGLQMNKLTIAMNQIAQGGTPQTPEQGKINMETISLIGDLFEKGAAAYKSLRGNESVVDSFTQQITENAKAEAIESLNIVHLINKKVKGKLVADIAGGIAENVINDSSKQNSHEPQ